jgi:hypothetical protein
MPDHGMVGEVREVFSEMLVKGVEVQGRGKRVIHCTFGRTLYRLMV